MATAIVAVWALVAILCVAWIVVIYVDRRYIGPFMNRNELFRVRSDLVRLVSYNKVSPVDPVFRTLYSLTNVSIANTRALYLSGFTQAAREKHLLREINNLIKDVKKTNNPDLQQVMAKYCDALVKVLRRNSFLTRLLWRRERTRQILKKVLPDLYEAREIGRACERGVGELVHSS